MCMMCTKCACECGLVSTWARHERDVVCAWVRDCCACRHETAWYVRDVCLVRAYCTRSLCLSCSSPHFCFSGLEPSNLQVIPTLRLGSPWVQGLPMKPFPPSLGQEAKGLTATIHMSCSWTKPSIIKKSQLK